MSYNSNSNMDNDFRQWYKYSRSSKSEQLTRQLKEVIQKKESQYGYIFESKKQGNENIIIINENYNPLSLQLSESTLTEFYKYLDSHFPENKVLSDVNDNLKNLNSKINEQHESPMVPKKRNYFLNNILKMISSIKINQHVFNYSLFAFIIAQLNILQIHFSNYNPQNNWSKYSLSYIFFIIYFLCIVTYSRFYYKISSFKDFFKTIILYTIFFILFVIAELSILKTIDTKEFPIGFWMLMYFIALFGGLMVSLITATICSLFQKIRKINKQRWILGIGESKFAIYLNRSKQFMFTSLLIFVIFMSFIDFYKIQVLKKDLPFLTEDNSNSEISNKDYKILKIYNGNNNYHLPCIIIEINEEFKEDDLINIQKQLYKKYPDYYAKIRTLIKYKSESYALVSSTIEDHNFKSDIQFVKDVNEKYSTVVKEFFEKKNSSEIKDHKIYGIYYNLGNCSNLIQNHPDYLRIITYDSSDNYFYSSFSSKIFNLKPIKFDGEKFILDTKVFKGITKPSVAAQNLYYINEYNDLVLKELNYIDEKREKYSTYLHHLKF